MHNKYINKYKYIYIYTHTHTYVHTNIHTLRGIPQVYKKKILQQKSCKIVKNLQELVADWQVVVKL